MGPKAGESSFCGLELPSGSQPHSGLRTFSTSPQSTPRLRTAPTYPGSVYPVTLFLEVTLELAREKSDRGQAKVWLFCCASRSLSGLRAPRRPGLSKHLAGTTLAGPGSVLWGPRSFAKLTQAKQKMNELPDGDLPARWLWTQ